MTTAAEIFVSDPELFERIAEQVEKSDTCESPMCQRAATVTLTFESGTERFCRIHANEVLAS